MLILFFFLVAETKTKWPSHVTIHVSSRETAQWAFPRVREGQYSVSQLVSHTETYGDAFAHV